MQISWDVFLKCIKDIQQMSDNLNDTWVCHNTEVEQQFTEYLTKKSSLNERTEDETPIKIEYHVVYSMSYSMPLLCMNAWRADGSLLTMEELWTFVKFLENEDMYGTLTQMDHPVLQRPFLTLHPCRTANLLETMFKDSKNPIVSWLSAVGPIVNLDIDINYIKLT